MNKLEIALYLVDEAIEKKKVYIDYYNEFKKYAKEGKLQEFYLKNLKQPSKQAILDNLKIARRMINEVMKEL